MTTFTHLEQRTDWQDKTDLNSVAHMPLTKGTSLNGNKRDFSFTADTPFAGTLFVLHLGAQVTLPNNIELEFQRQASSINCNAFESDLKLVMHKQIWDMSSQIWFKENVAQVWRPGGGWVNTVVKPNLDPTQLVHIKWCYELLSDRVIYKSITINGDLYPLYMDFPIIASTWADGLLLQMQQAVVTASKTAVASLTDSIYNTTVRIA